MWLSFGLKYQWTLPGNALGLNFNASEVFDPFSPYIPLRVEARLDDAIMDYVYRDVLRATATFSSQSDLAMAHRIPQKLSAQNSLMVPTSTSYQEPTILWNAAQHHLPYIHVGSSKIFSPAIAEPPSDDDEPNAEPVVRVIGADPLFSHVTEGRPVKAVRVVQLKHTPAQRRTRIFRSSAPAQPQVQRSLLSPILAEPALQPPDGGFVLVGSVNLFGVSSLSAQFEKWEGPAPSDVIILPDKPVSVERATLAKDFHFSSVIAALEGTAFDTITFRNVSVYYQNYKFDTTKAVGWHFNADLVIDESCGALREVLSTALGVSESTLSIYLFLGVDGGWHRPPSLHSFILEGVFAGLAVKPINGVVLSKIGVRLFGIRMLKYDPTPRSALDFGFSVFGSMNLDVPGSTVPLTMDYEIQEYSGTICLGANIDFWKNPLGASGLVLSGVSFSASFALSSPWKSLAFGVSADLVYENVSTTFQGFFSPRGAFELKASIHDVTVKTIDTLFRCISHGDLSLPDVDVSIGTASLTITSDNGFSIALESVTIGDYTSLDAGLTITSHNVTLRGKLTTDAVQFGDVELKGAFLQVTFETKGSEKTTDLILGGQVAFSTLAFDAAVHLYKSPDRSAKSLEWTLLASLTVSNDALALSKVVPKLRGTPFDLALTQAVFVAASRDDPSMGNMVTSGFSFHQGVQVCAVLGEIDALNSLMRGSVPGQYIHDQLMGQFYQARRAAKDGIDAAQKDVDKAEAAWKAGVDKAQATLDAAKKTWDAKNERITTESNKIIDAYNKEIERLQQDITYAQKDCNAAMTNAQNAVSAAERDRAQALQSAQHDVDNAKREMNDAIDAAQRGVDYAERDFDSAFGSAQAAIESARRDVQSLQNQINDIYGTIHDYADAPWYDYWKKAAIAGLYVAVGTLEASKAVADGILQAAVAVLTSANFIAKQTAFNAAKAALVAARATGQASLDVANGALIAADKTSQATLDLVNATLQATKDGVEWGVLQGAKEALQIYKEANDATFRATTQALVDLIKCAEYLAYQTAKAGLDVVRAATVTLNAARAALELAREVGDEAFEIGQWVVDHVFEAFDIRVVHLSGRQTIINTLVTR